MKQLWLFLGISIAVIGNAHAQSDYLDRGNSYLNDGAYDKAEKTFRDAVKAEPQNLTFQCQLGLTLIDEKKYNQADSVLSGVLIADSNNLGAMWYSGIGNWQAGNDRKAIGNFERVLPSLPRHSGQSASALWFIGKSYSSLLKTEGLTQKEIDRMLQCYEAYLKLQPDAQDAKEISAYVNDKQQRRPPSNVERWKDQ